MAEQCIVCLDTLLHAIEPPPPPLSTDDGKPHSGTTSPNASDSSTDSIGAATNTTVATAPTASPPSAGHTAVLTINTLSPVRVKAELDPPAATALAVPGPSTTTTTTTTTTTNGSHASASPMRASLGSSVKLEDDEKKAAFGSSEPKSLEDDNVAVIQTCGHTLHNTCLKEWTAKANSCPICRQNFYLVEVYDKIGGTKLDSYPVEDKKQVAEIDHQALFDEYNEIHDSDVSVPCPVCDRADREDVLLLCDGCDSAYHTHCIGLDAVPEGAWFCMECVTLFGDAVTGPQAQGPPVRGAARSAGQRTGTRRRRGNFFPRTRETERRANQRAARSDQWQGAWGQITGQIWDALNIDLDHDEDDSLEEYRRVERRLDNERREFQQWQERLDIARRAGAEHIFGSGIPSALLQHASRRGGTALNAASSSAARAPSAASQQTRVERQAWGDLERARDQGAQPANSRKRKSRSITGSPAEPPPEPERKLKRPRTRRIGAPPEPGPSAAAGSAASGGFGGFGGPGGLGGSGAASRTPSVSAAVQTPSALASGNSAAMAASSALSSALSSARAGSLSDTTSSGLSARSPALGSEQPSFLSSLLKEVEMSTPSDDENIRSLFGEMPHATADPQSPAGSSPAVSPGGSPRLLSTTPPPPAHRPLRASSPTLLSSHILPNYPPANYSPTRTAHSPGHGSDNSDSEGHVPSGKRGARTHRSPSSPTIELRHPRPRRLPSMSTAPAPAQAPAQAHTHVGNSARSPDSSPTRSGRVHMTSTHHALPLEMKESISRIVRSALSPHWKASQLTAEQYAAINRDVSRRLYEEVSDPAAVDAEVRRMWEHKATREVARAVAELQA